MINSPSSRPLAQWLTVAAASIFIMVIIGAITRLTESGLSMVEWKPLIGILPPLDAAEWQRVFGLYQQTPEYIHKNAGMDLDAFKNIFFWEWLHRTWGHVIGLVYAVPLVVFVARGMVPRVLLSRLLGIFALGGVQAFLGWYMVASGLVDRPDVSHYRLALHLSTALVIFALIVWTILDLRQPRGTTTFCKWRHGWSALGILAVTIVYGAFVAGLDAGFVYNTWPLMDGQFVPVAIDTLQPWWLNALQNTAGVQFIHRWLAIAAAAIIIAYAWRVQAVWLGIAVVVQVLLGIATLLTHMHIHVAVLHQANAVVTLTLLLVALHRTGSYKA